MLTLFLKIILVIRTLNMNNVVFSKGISYSALAVSDNGTFVGTGTMSEVK